MYVFSIHENIIMIYQSLVRKIKTEKLGLHGVAHDGPTKQ